MCSFLPFTAYLIQPHKPKTAQPKPILSHQPLQQEDPLPCLKLFSSLDFSSHVDLDGVDDSNPSYLQNQRHVIDIIDPQRLLTASVSATINSNTKEVLALSIQIPTWAERDLGSFTLLKAQENDLSAMCWALGSYWEMSKKRAEFWHKCETTFSHLIPGRIGEDDENTKQGLSEKSARPLTRKDLRRHLGRDMLILEDKHVLLQINWRIRFDWTGEAESDISIDSAFPRVCKLLVMFDGDWVD